MSLGDWHLRNRKRIASGLPAYPHPDAFRRRFDSMMLFVGMLAPLALLPQVIEIYAMRDAGNFSLFTWCTLAIINSLWTTYGFLHKERPIMFANGGLVLLNVSIVIGILLF